MKKTSKNFKATQTARFGWNKSASLCCRSFQKENKSDNTDRTPQKFRKKENRRNHHRLSDPCPCRKTLSFRWGFVIMRESERKIF